MKGMRIPPPPPGPEQSCELSPHPVSLQGVEGCTLTPGERKGETEQDGCVLR